ncbi:MAG TPA: histidine phosphatase family protein [Streptosporangiaceae bacterium]|nr:histidine phosphatase family protein [Streptosporangiaceae bacterium]
MGTLIVLRHAKAASGIGLADADRPLTSPGRRDAEAAGRHLRDNGLVPGLVLCSPVVRTRQTLEALRLGPEVEVSYEPRIYQNDVDLLFELVRTIPDDTPPVLVIGHNPALHQFVADLGAVDVDRFPTSACAVLTFEGAWGDLAPGGAVLTSYWTPKTG